MSTPLKLLAVAMLGLVTHVALAATQTRTSAFEYDPATGLLTKEIIEPDNSTLCLVTTYVYDAYGNKTSATTRNCNGSSSEALAPTGDAVFSTRTSTAAFAAGSVVIGVVTYNWSAGQFPTTSTNALNQSETKEFDPRFGGATKLTGPNALVTQWTYDGFGRKLSEARADGTATNWTYTRCVDNPAGCPTYGGYLVTEASTGAPAKTVYFDSLNREIRSEAQGFDGTLVRKDTQYDALGRVAQVSRPYYALQTVYWTTFSYDVLGRVTDAVEPTTTAGTAKTHTDYNGLVVSVTVSNNGVGTNMPGAAVQTKTTTKNSQGQVVQVADTQNNTIAYTYDPFGNLTRTNAGGVITTLGYDLRGRKTSMTDPDMGSWIYAYNALGELIRQVDAKAQTVSMAYDALGRMTSRTEPDLISTWTYDTCVKGVGKLCSTSADNGYARTHAYDSLGRPSSVSLTIDTSYAVTTSYDSAGRVDTVTYPTGFAVKNLYNSYGYLWKVQRTNDPDTTVFWQANSQNAAGQVTSELLGNGLTSSCTYDTLFRKTGTTASNAGGAVHNLGFTFDAIGNVIQRQDLVQALTESFAYDTLNRLMSASGAGLTTRSFDYVSAGSDNNNALGNIHYKSDVGTYTYLSTSNTRPHAVSSVTNGGVPNSVTATYSYDGNGNLTSASGTIYPASGSVSFSRTLTYKSFNAPAALTHVQGAATYSYTYTYNIEHERVKLVTVRPDDTLTSIYVHPAGKGALLYEKEIRQSTAVIEHKHYVNGGSGLVGVFVTKSSYVSPDGPAMRYYHRDHLGSVVAITNPAAAVIERLAYEPFGERRYPNGSPENRASPLIGITTDRGFTAHEHLDEMMLIHMNGRIYDPLVGRFMTPDPLVSDPRNLQNYNRYAYVLNNPLRFVDPTGYNHGMISWQNAGLDNAYNNSMKGMSLMWTIDVTTYNGGNNDSVPSGNSSDTSKAPTLVNPLLLLPDYDKESQLGSGATNLWNPSLDQNTKLASADVQNLFNDASHAYNNNPTICDVSNPGCSASTAWGGLQRNWYAGADGKEVVRDNGTYFVFGFQERGRITSNVDYDRMTIVNTAESGHIFCCGSVALSVVQTDTVVSLSIIGDGPNSGWLNAAANWVAGKVGFAGNVEGIRAYVQSVGRWSSYGAIANPDAPPPPQ